MCNIAVVPYENSHFDAIAAIHDAARMIELKYANLEAAFLPLTIAAEREGLFDYTVDVALINNVPAGFCAYTDEELAWLYVAPEHFRKGVGAALLNHAIKTQPEIHELEVLEGNHPARSLYEKMGFTVRETVSGKMPGNESFTVRVWCMER